MLFCSQKATLKSEILKSGSLNNLAQHGKCQFLSKTLHPNPEPFLTTNIHPQSPSAPLNTLNLSTTHNHLDLLSIALNHPKLPSTQPDQ